MLSSPENDPRPKATKGMRRYSYIKGLGLSLYSAGFYRDVARRWKGLAIVFLLLSIVALGGAAAVLQTVVFNPERVAARGFAGATFQLLTNNLFVPVVAQFPEIAIEGGKARASVPQPYVIKRPVTNEAFIILDTTGKTTTLQNTAANALITDQAVIVKENGKDMVQAQFKDMADTVMTRDMLLRFGPLSLLPINLIYMCIMFIINGFALGGLAYFMNVMMKTELEFADTIRLAMVTTTPLLMLEALQALLGVSFFRFPVLVYFLMQTAYLYHALDVNRRRA